MKNIGVIFGSTTGSTEAAAGLIAEKLGVDSDNVYNVSDVDADVLAKYDVLLLGTSTWGEGELQDDWFDGVNVVKEGVSGKTIALFGCGDAEGHPDTFCGGMGVLYNELKDAGCTIVGSVDASEYNFSESEAAIEGKFVGLALDDLSESDKTEDRISAWIDVIKPSFE